MSEWWKNFAVMFGLVVVVICGSVSSIVAVIELVKAFGPLAGAGVIVGIVATVLGICFANDQARRVPWR